MATLNIKDLAPVPFPDVQLAVPTVSGSDSRINDILILMHN